MTDDVRQPASASKATASADRFDRRFRIEGDVVEALRVLMAADSEKDS